MNTNELDIMEIEIMQQEWYAELPREEVYENDN